MLVHTGTTEAGDAVERAPAPPDRRVPERPVFVDASGRRQRRVRRIGRILVVPAVAYVGLLASTLLGGPTINSPWLPLPAGPHAQGGGSSGSVVRHGASGGRTGGAGTGATGTQNGATAGTGTASGVTAGAGATAGSTGASGAPSALPSLTASPSLSASPSAVVTHGRSTHTATPPGASHRPTKKATATAP